MPDGSASLASSASEKELNGALARRCRRSGRAEIVVGGGAAVCLCSGLAEALVLSLAARKPIGPCTTSGQ